MLHKFDRIACIEAMTCRCVSSLIILELGAICTSAMLFAPVKLYSDVHSHAASNSCMCLTHLAQACV